MPSITIWCDSPIPSASRPPAAAFVGQRLTGEHHRVTRVGGHHRGAELDVGHLPPDDGEKRQTRHG